MSKKVLMLASNLGLWGEELQAPWDALKKAGHELTLATERGITPLPMILSMDPEFVDPVQQYNVNPQEVVDRIKQILETGEWDNPIKFADAKMADYDAIVAVGGPGSPLDISGNAKVHRLMEEAYKDDKIIGALCYAVGAYVWARNADNDGNSIIYGKKVVAHPREWDFTGDLPYPLYGATPENPGTDVVTPGFVYPLAVVVEHAVGPNGQVLSDPTANREKPSVMYDFPFVTGLSVESSIAFGDKMVEVLAIAPTPRWKFYKNHLNYFSNKDVEGLVKNDYNEDAVLAAPDFVVQGHAALREIFKGYLEMIGDMTLKTTDKFVETENSIYLEATLQTSNLGERKVTDAFVLKDGKISYHFTGVK